MTLSTAPQTQAAASVPTDSPSPPPAVPAPQDTALLLVDYFNAATSFVNPESVTNGARLLESARQKGVRIVHCLIDFDQPVLPGSKMAPRIQQLLEARKHQPSVGDEHPAFAAASASEEKRSQTQQHDSNDDEHWVVRRPGLVSAMESTGIEELLKGKKALLIAGLVTGGCVLSTARAATDRGYSVTVATDACGDREQETHDMLVEKVLPMTAHCATTEEVITAWK